MTTAISHLLPRSAQDGPSIVTVMRFAACALAAVVVVSVAGCTSSTNGAASSTSSAPPTSAASAKADSHVAGLVSSLSGNTIQVAARDGGRTVDFTNSTKIWSLAGGQWSDVLAGACVTVRPTRDGNAGSTTVTAAAVQIVPPSNGQCPGPSGNRPVAGAVGTVTGDTFTVAATGTAAQTSVSVTDKTRYAKRLPADARAISRGECVSASGIRDSGGALQASSITVRLARRGSCRGSRG
jgi:hypothetical protein